MFNNKVPVAAEQGCRTGVKKQTPWATSNGRARTGKLFRRRNGPN